MKPRRRTASASKSEPRTHTADGERTSLSTKAIDQSFHLADRYSREEGTVLLSGMEALVRMLIDQRRLDRRNGLRTATLISGYPGSPLGTLDIAIRREQSILREHDIRLVPGVNEELAASAVWGTQQVALAPNREHDGVVGIWYGKGPGVDRCGDVFRHANNVGIARNGGVLALAGDDPSQKSSTIPSRSEVAFFDVGMPVLSPGSVQDVLDYGLLGLALSRYSGLWVGLQILTDVADGMGTAVVDLERLKVQIPNYEVDGKAWHHEPLRWPGAFSIAAERELHLHRLEAARLFASANELNRITVDAPNADIGILCAGKTYFDVRQALDTLGLSERTAAGQGIRILKLGMLWPLEPQVIHRFAAGLKTILVIEEKRGFVEMLLRDLLYGSVHQPEVIGKRSRTGESMVPPEGELTPDRIMPVIADVFAGREGLGFVRDRLKAVQRPLLAQPPLQLTESRHAFFCSGCPHNRSTVVPEGSIAGGGIGCHTMALSRPGHLGLMPMGGEGANWVGRAPFTAVDHIFQNLGDGTYFHSGSLAIRACIAAGVNITYKLLFNGAIAMTGGQSSAGGVEVRRVAAELLAEGAQKVVVVTPDPKIYGRAAMPTGVSVRSRDDIDRVQEELRAIPGTTVLIYDQPCAAELRRKRKRGDIEEPAARIKINESICEGCGDCGQKSNCLSVQPVDTEFGRKTRIHQSSCNKDYSCVTGDCPSFVKVIPKRQLDRQARAPRFPEVELPDPIVDPELASKCDILMTGIGGTGVITVNHVLATAAVMEGMHAAGLDQTGVSQKAGPVVSHLKLANQPIVASAAVGAGGTDLLLGMDALVAVDPRNLARANPERTRAVLSTSKVPTGQMVSNVGVEFPELDRLVKAVDAVSRPGSTVYIDSMMLAENLLGDHMAANLIVIGAAYQAGWLPVTARAIERALELNGVSVQMNVAAFRWGRAAVADAEYVRTATHDSSVEEGTEPGEPAVDYGPRTRAETDRLLAAFGFDGSLTATLRLRVLELVDYQGSKLARDYLTFVQRVAEAEHRTTESGAELTRSVARNLFKLLAYKDEYEVARLYLRPSFRRELKLEFGDAKVTYLLHPPFLRALGVDKKIPLGSWFVPGFWLLKTARFLRGTPFDLFGRTELRRAERSLPIEYQSAIESLLPGLDAHSFATALEVAGLPDGVRGYESIKAASIQVFRQRLAGLEAEPSIRAVQAR